MSGKARAYDQHSHFDFSSGCFKSLQTGVDHSYVHTKQISIRNHYTKQKQVPSKVYGVGYVGCVESEGVTVCTKTGVAKHQLTSSGT